MVNGTILPSSLDGKEVYTHIKREHAMVHFSQNITTLLVNSFLKITTG